MPVLENTKLARAVRCLVIMVISAGMLNGCQSLGSSAAGAKNEGSAGYKEENKESEQKLLNQSSKSTNTEQDAATRSKVDNKKVVSRTSPVRTNPEPPKKKPSSTAKSVVKPVAKPVSKSRPAEARPKKSAKSSSRVAAAITSATPKAAAVTTGKATATSDAVRPATGATVQKQADKVEAAASQSATSSVASNERVSKVAAGGSTSSKTIVSPDAETETNSSGLSDATEKLPSPDGEATKIAMLDPSALADSQAQIEQAIKSPGTAINLTLDMLPYEFDGWVLEHNWDNQHPQTCRLRSARTAINDGYESTYLWAEILPKEINIYTGSNIDLTYDGAGLQIGDNPLQSFSGFLNETSVSLAGDHSTTLRLASELTVSLGFWPTWPKTETQQVVLSSAGLAEAMPVFKACQLWSE